MFHSDNKIYCKNIKHLNTSLKTKKTGQRQMAYIRLERYTEWLFKRKTLIDLKSQFTTYILSGNLEVDTNQMFVRYTWSLQLHQY